MLKIRGQGTSGAINRALAMRLTILFVLLVSLVLVPFVLFGETVDALFSDGGARQVMEGFGNWAWLAGIALIVADLFLPVPATLVMSALGYTYGVFAGGLLAAAGSFLAGMTGYVLCRAAGVRAALFLLGPSEMARGKRLMQRTGGWIVALSRWLPVFPEVVSCMAGLLRMPPTTFSLALACGALPLGFVYAAVGAAGVARPGLAIALSALLPLVLWLSARPVAARLSRTSDEATEGRR